MNYLKGRHQIGQRITVIPEEIDSPLRRTLFF